MRAVPGPGHGRVRHGRFPVGDRAAVVALLPKGVVDLHDCHMSHTITIRLTKELAEWLADRAARSGLPQGRIVRDQLERARATDQPKFMRLAGSVNGGPRAVSKRKGFAAE